MCVFFSAPFEHNRARTSPRENSIIFASTTTYPAQLNLLTSEKEMPRKIYNDRMRVGFQSNKWMEWNGWRGAFYEQKRLPDRREIYFIIGRTVMIELSYAVLLSRMCMPIIPFSNSYRKETGKAMKRLTKLHIKSADW